MFKRKIYDQLLEWKKSSSRECALLIDGARRVGKSYIVEEFAKAEYRSYAIIDFTNATKSVKDLFLKYISDLDTFFAYLSSLTNVTFYKHETLIVFDEVQHFPKAREAIKHLVKDGRYDYIETGSLVSINENVKDILIPSEERDIEMYPMDFEEFLWATGRPTLMDSIRRAFKSGEKTRFGSILSSEECRRRWSDTSKATISRRSTGRNATCSSCTGRASASMRSDMRCALNGYMTKSPDSSRGTRSISASVRWGAMRDTGNMRTHFCGWRMRWS